MKKGIRKWFTIGVALVLIMGMSACGKDTSVVDKIAADQEKTAGEPEITAEQEKVTKNEKAESQTTRDAENTLNSLTDGTQKASNNAQETSNNAQEASDNTANGIDLVSPEQKAAKAEGEDAAAKASPDEGKSGIDVDLTKLSSTMVYSEVYNMMSKPEDYVGKTIKIEGTYYASYWKETGKYYHCVLISDATACCQNGIEFVWDDNTHIYPDEYPSDNTVIELTGVFGLYEEKGETYCYLKTDDITVH